MSGWNSTTIFDLIISKLLLCPTLNQQGNRLLALWSQWELWDLPDLRKREDGVAVPLSLPAQRAELTFG